jgi:hypothetical protein
LESPSVSIGAFDGARSDVDDPSEASRDHAVENGFDQLDRRQHVRIERRNPSRPIPFAEIAGRRPAGIGDEDLRRRRGGERGGAPLGSRDVRGDRGDGYSGRRPNLRRGLLERLATARDDRQRDALARQRQGAASTEPAACRAHQCGFAR